MHAKEAGLARIALDALTIEDMPLECQTITTELGKYANPTGEVLPMGCREVNRGRLDVGCWPRRPSGSAPSARASGAKTASCAWKQGQDACGRRP